MINNTVNISRKNGEGEVKKSLRKFYAAARRNISAAERVVFNREINRRVIELFEKNNRRLAASYLADANEVNLQEFNRWLLERDGVLFLPRYNCCSQVYEFARHEAGKELIHGKYDLLEPDDYATGWNRDDFSDDLWYLVPALAFDAAGNRLGRGGGFYDRLLENASGKIIGVGYECQWSEELLPAEAHDHKMDLIITENGLRVIS